MLLKDNEIKDFLKELDGWSKSGDEITKTYMLKDFIDAMGFVNRIAVLAEKANHHPDILIKYRKVVIVLSTHSEGGITIKDINLAKEIEGLSS